MSSVFRRFARLMVHGAVATIHRMRRPLTRWKLEKYDRINLGAGGHARVGWANVDITGWNNLIWDLTKPLPLASGALRYVYSEHFIEHVSREDAVRLLANARARMPRDGAIRISTPDLRLFSQAYLAGSVPELWTERNPTRMFNELMRNWGHTFLYDETELTSVLQEAGFSRVKRVERNISEHEALRNLEIRPDQLDLILEAQP